MAANSKLSMLDEFGVRTRIIPAEVKGRFRNYRVWVHAVLLFIFVALPWIKINDRQAVLIRIFDGRLDLFGAVFQAHDAPLLFFIVSILTLLIILTTAIWGRAWCGWACPQTVFIDAVFRRIEILVEGNYIERRRLLIAPLTPTKMFKFILKWFLFLLVSLGLAHSFIAYFTGGEKLISMLQGSPTENWIYFLMVVSMTALVLFNFGWFREQFCIIMCPYGRFQSVLLDQQSLVVTYNETRGEPRKAPQDLPSSRGDCVSCNRCVQVCPTGIDIRNGLQMECISCTACIDACDEIMQKVNKPTGLIGYASSVPINYLRPRVVAYCLLFIVCSAGLAYNLVKHALFSAVLLRGAGAPYEITSDGQVLNHFKVNIHNQGFKSQLFTISQVDKEKWHNVKFIIAVPIVSLQAGESKEVHFFIAMLKTNMMHAINLQIKIEESTSAEHQVFDVQLVGPN